MPVIRPIPPPTGPGTFLTWKDVSCGGRRRADAHGGTGGAEPLAGPAPAAHESVEMARFLLAGATDRHLA